MGKANKTKKKLIKEKLSLSINIPKEYDKYINILLFIIIISAFLLRIIFLDKNPSALNQDEAINGYNAFSISKTAKDSRGTFLPFLVYGFGNVDFRSPLYVYLSVPFMWLMGLCGNSVKIVALLLNTLLIFIVYLFTDKLFKNKIISVTAALFLAMEPWNFHFSRLGHEATIVPFFYFLSVLFLIKGLKDNEDNKLLFLLSGFVFGISEYSYQTTRLLSPLMFVFLCFVYKKEVLKKKWHVISTAIAAIFVALPLIYASITNPNVESRFAQVSVFNSQDPLGNIIINYFMHYSPKFLFFEGDKKNLPGMDGHGMLQLYLAPLIIFGVIYLFRLLKNIEYRREVVVVFGMLLFYPLVAAVTFPAPHALRGYTFVPIFEVIGAVGLYSVLKSLYHAKFNVKHKIIVFALIAVTIFYSFACFLYKYIYVYPKSFESYYQYGMKQAVDYVKDNESKYSKVYFTSYSNQPFIYFLFYMNFDPAKYINTEKKIDYKGFGRVDQFDKYYFAQDQLMPFEEKKCLFITKPNDISGKKLLKVIKNSNGEAVFNIWE